MHKGTGHGPVASAQHTPRGKNFNATVLRTFLCSCGSKQQFSKNLCHCSRVLVCIIHSTSDWSCSYLNYFKVPYQPPVQLNSLKLMNAVMILSFLALIGRQTFGKLNKTAGC